MESIVPQSNKPAETLDSAELEHRGACAYYQGIKRAELATDAERRGWDDACGEDSYYRALWEEIQENESIGRSESLQPWQW